MRSMGFRPQSDGYAHLHVNWENAATCYSKTISFEGEEITVQCHLVNNLPNHYHFEGPAHSPALRDLITLLADYMHPTQLKADQCPEGKSAWRAYPNCHVSVRSHFLRKLLSHLEGNVPLHTALGAYQDEVEGDPKPSGTRNRAYISPARGIKLRNDILEQFDLMLVPQANQIMRGICQLLPHRTLDEIIPEIAPDLSAEQQAQLIGLAHQAVRDTHRDAMRSRSNLR